MRPVSSSTLSCKRPALTALLLAVLALMVSGTSHAEDPAAAPKPEAVAPEPAPGVVEESKEEIKTPSLWDSLGFGVALGVTYPRHRDSMVEEAFLDGNNIVRPRNQQQVLSPVLVEAHCFDCFFFSDKTYRNKSVSPFVALSVGGDGGQILNGIGYGIMIGFRNKASLARGEAIETLHDFDTGLPDSDRLDNTRVRKARSTLKANRADPVGTRTSFNIGLGLYHQFNVQQLADGLHPNQPLPAGYGQVEYKRATRTSIMLIFSFSWE